MILKCHEYFQANDSQPVSSRCRKRRIRRGSMNFHKRISHPFIEGKSITRRSTRYRHKKTMINMKSFNPDYSKPTSEEHDLVQKTASSETHGRMRVIIGVVISILFLIVFPFALFGFIRFVSFVSVVSITVISCIAIVAEHELFAIAGRIFISVNASEFNQPSVQFNVSSKISTLDLVKKIKELLPTDRFYLTYAGKSIQISDSIHLNDLNIIPRAQHYVSYLFVMHTGCIGGGKQNDRSSRRKQKKSNKPLDEYLKQGSLLLFKSYEPNDDCEIDHYRLGEIIHFDSSKFCTFRCHEILSVFTSLYVQKCLTILYCPCIFVRSVTLLDFKSNSEVTIGWNSTYLEVDLDDATPVHQTQNGRPLAAKDECFAMGYNTVLPATVETHRKQQYAAHRVKFPTCIFYKATFKARRYNVTAIRWNHYQQDAVIPKWENIHDHDLYTVWRIIPTTESIPYLKIQQQCLTQEKNSILSSQQQKKNSRSTRYHYNFKQHNSYVIEEEPESQNDRNVTKSAVAFPEPSASPTPVVSPSYSSPSSKPKTDLARDANATINRKRMKRFLSKVYVRKTRYHRRTQRAKFICKTTRRRSNEKVSINHKTPIKFSTKYEFCLRYEDKNKKFGNSCKAIWEGMKKEGFEVGKTPDASQKWKLNGSKYYQNLIIKKGKDGYKLSSLLYVYFLCKYMTNNSPLSQFYLDICKADRGMKDMKGNLLEKY